MNDPVILYDAAVFVDYGQFYVVANEGWESLVEVCFEGQVNGLCGAAQPGGLFLMTGTRYGEVPVRAELHDSRPSTDDAWEDVVEASLEVVSGPELVPWGRAGSPLALAPGTYRVRYGALGMDATDRSPAWAAPADRYLLQFWRAAAEPDAVLRETSASAGYWHRHARGLPPQPDVAERAAAQAAADRRETGRRVAAANEEHRREMLARWGGTVPSDRLSKVIARFPTSVPPEFWPLLRLADDAGDDELLRLARFCLRDAFRTAGMFAVSWADLVLAAVEAGDHLPPPFDDLDRVPWGAIKSDPAIPFTTVPHGRSGDVLGVQALAMAMILTARRPDPVSAAIETLGHACRLHGTDLGSFLRVLQGAFPGDRA